MSEPERERGFGIFRVPNQDDLDMAHLSYINGLHETHDVIDSLNQDQFSAMLDLLRAATHNPDNGNYLIGRLQYQFNLKFDKCIKCGQEAHDPTELLQSVSDDNGSSRSET
jgi:hypothetical protein